MVGVCILRVEIERDVVPSIAVLVEPDVERCHRGDERWIHMRTPDEALAHVREFLEATLPTTQ